MQQSRFIAHKDVSALTVRSCIGSCVNMQRVVGLAVGQEVEEEVMEDVGFGGDVKHLKKPKKKLRRMKYVFEEEMEPVPLFSMFNRHVMRVASWIRIVCAVCMCWLVIVADRLAVCDLAFSGVAAVAMQHSRTQRASSRRSKKQSPKVSFR